MSRGDRLVLVLALLLLPALYALTWGGAPGERASVMVGGREVQTVDLHRDQEVSVEGALGPSTLRVEDGRIRFTASPCHGKQCVHSGWLDRSGEFAACLPNRVSIAVRGGEPRYDSVNF